MVEGVQFFLFDKRIGECFHDDIIFRNVTHQRKREEFVLSGRARPVSGWQEIAGEWWVWLDTKNRKVYTNGVDLPVFFFIATDLITGSWES